MMSTATTETVEVAAAAEGAGEVQHVQPFPFKDFLFEES